MQKENERFYDKLIKKSKNEHAIPDTIQLSGYKEANDYQKICITFNEYYLDIRSKNPNHTDKVLRIQESFR